MSKVPVAAIPAAQPQVPPSRMTLGAITRGRVETPWRLLVFGPEGVGKSTLGADMPNPIFLGAEDGTGHLNVARFPTPESWRDVLDAVVALGRHGHQFKTLVIDTLDWVEPLIWRHVCARDNEANIEAYGYGKGFQVAVDEWRMLLRGLQTLRGVGMNVLMLAHSHQKTFKNPEGEDFDRYELALNIKAAGVLKQWADAVLFANYETYAKKDERTKRVKGVSTGARLLYTERTAAYDAKNRFGLPAYLPLDWAGLDTAIKAGAPADVASLVEECKRKAVAMGGALEVQVTEAIARAGGDAEKLSKLNNWCNATLKQQADKAGKAV